MIDYQKLSVDLLKPENANVTSAAFLATANAQTIVTKKYISKQVVNNFIVANNLNLKLRGVTLQPVNVDTIDKPIAAAGGLTVRLAALAGLDFLLTDSGDDVNPNNANIQGLIGLLAQSGVFTSLEVERFWALFETHSSVAERDYGGLLTANDIAVANLLPRRNAVQTQVVALEAQLGVLRQAVSELEAGRDVAGLVI